MASRDEVRRWSTASANGAELTQSQQDAIRRTTKNAGSEGRLVKRLLKGEKK